jgi:ribosomal protein L18
MAKKVNTKKTKIKSTTERLRLSLYKSNVSTYAQVIDDEKNLTKIGVLIKKTKGKTKVQSRLT